MSEEQKDILLNTEDSETEVPDIKLTDFDFTNFEVPDYIDPEIDEPEVDEPEVDEPEIEEPEIDEPEVDEPEIDEPEVDEPIADAPEVEEPDVDETEVEEPEVEEPDEAIYDEEDDTEADFSELNEEEGEPADGNGAEETGADDFYFDEIDADESEAEDFVPFVKEPEGLYDEPDDEPDAEFEEVEEKAASRILKEDAAAGIAFMGRKAKDKKLKEDDPEEDDSGEDDSEEDDPKEKKKMGAVLKGLLIGGFVIIMLFLCFVGVYIGIADDYKTRYLPGTTINGVDVSEGTPAEFEDSIRVGAEVYSIDLTFRDSSETIDGTQFGYHYVSSGEAQQILDNQDIYAWGLSKFGKTYEYKISWSTDYDRELLRSVVAALPELQPENETKPQNAYLNLNEDLTFSIIPEVQGNYVFNEPVINTVLDAVENRLPSVDFNTMEGIYDAPVVFGNNPDLNWELNNLNSFLSTSVTYNLPNGETRTLDRDDLVSWITRDDNGYYHVEESVVQANVNQFVAKMAADVYVEYPQLPFNTTKHGLIWFDYAGGYAVILNEEEEKQALFNNIWNHESATREPAYIRNDSNIGYNMGGSYVELDMSLQHVYMYENGELIYEAPCVSGTFYHAGYVTPVGIHKLNGKMEDATLYGPKDKNGEYTYIAEVEYWMPFTGSCGFHDAQWRDESEFGTDQYLYNGSHGCVNLSLDKARELYEKIYVGIPVVIYYVTD